MWFVVGAALGALLAYQIKSRGSQDEPAVAQKNGLHGDDSGVQEPAVWVEDTEADGESTDFSKSPDTPTVTGTQGDERTRTCVCGCYERVGNAKYRFVIANHIQQLRVDQVIQAMFYCANPVIDDVRMEHDNRLLDSERYGLCACGCRGMPGSKDARYSQGHDVRYKMAMLRLLEKYC